MLHGKHQVCLREEDLRRGRSRAHAKGKVASTGRALMQPASPNRFSLIRRCWVVVRVRRTAPGQQGTQLVRSQCTCGQGRLRPGAPRTVRGLHAAAAVGLTSRRAMMCGCRSLMWFWICKGRAAHVWAEADCRGTRGGVRSCTLSAGGHQARNLRSGRAQGSPCLCWL